MAVLVTGTPGVGKTSVAQSLASTLGKKYVDVARLAAENNLVKGFDPELQAYIVDTSSVRALLEEILTCNEVVDTHIVECVPKRKVTHVIVLRLNPLELKKRLEARGYPNRKIAANVEAEVLDSVLIDAVKWFGERKVFEVDTTGKSVGEIVNIVRLVLEGKGRNFKPGNVNWLENFYYLLGKT